MVIRYLFFLFVVWNGVEVAGWKLIPVRQLPYSYRGLEPHLSRTTVERHYEVHYRHGVRTLNRMVLDTKRLRNHTLEDIMVDSYEWNKPMYRRAADSWNHDFYFKCMTVHYVPPSQTLVEQIEHDFGSFTRFSVDFRKAGNAVVGSGWAWVVYDVLEKVLRIRTTTGADNPMTINEFHRPILAMDMWEHAYALDYQNARDYTDAFISALVDWRFVEETLMRVKVEADRTKEELERRRLENEAKVASRKAEMERLLAEVYQQAKKVELEKNQVERGIHEESAPAFSQARNELNGELHVVDNYGHGAKYFDVDTLMSVDGNLTLVGRVDELFEEILTGIDIEKRSRLLRVFRLVRNGSVFGINLVGGVLRKIPWLPRFFFSTSSRKSKDVDVNATSTQQDSGSIVVTNEKDNPDIATITIEALNNVSSLTSIESAEEMPKTTYEPTNPLLKLLFFIWKIIRSFFRLLRYIWSLG